MQREKSEVSHRPYTPHLSSYPHRVAGLRPEGGEEECNE